MPTDRGFAWGEWTPQKYEHYSAICRMLLRIWAEVFRNHGFYGWTFHHIDAMAGPGMCSELGLRGSPLLFLDAINGTAELMRFRVDLIEKHPDHYESLLKSIEPQFEDFVHVHNGSYEEHIPKILEKTNILAGLLFIDPTHVSDLHLETLELVSQERPRMDILTYIGATFLKRSAHYDSIPQLAEYTGNIQKRCWFVREPMGKEQWTFLLGTNYPSMGDYKRIGLFRSDSARGQKIWRRLTNTAKELGGWEQGTLPNIEPTPNT